MTQDSDPVQEPSSGDEGLLVRPAIRADAVGPTLRALRESKGLTLDEVSSRLKFSSRQLQALETQQWDVLPRGVALRGMVRNYALMLGADPKVLLQGIESQIGKIRTGLADSVLARGSPSFSDPRSLGSLIWVAVIVIVLAAAVAYAFWQGWLPQDWLSFDWVAREKP